MADGHRYQEHGISTGSVLFCQRAAEINDGDLIIENETGKTYEPGNFVDESGNILGRHKGLIHYTIGQRKGLGITAATPLFVKELRPATNEVVII